MAGFGDLRAVVHPARHEGWRDRLAVAATDLAASIRVVREVGQWSAKDRISVRITKQGGERVGTYRKR
jgi:hypothetical protein